MFRFATCELEYERSTGLRAVTACPFADVARSGAFGFGDYLTLVLALDGDSRGTMPLFANVTPQGRIANGWLPVGDIVVP